jgi:hypothetical protein
MPPNPAPSPKKPDDPAQYQRLLDLAEELGVDGSVSADEVFDRLKPAIINPPPKPVPKKRQPRDQ